MSVDTRGAVAACRRCVHRFVSHDAAFPCGCRALGFKSRRAPVLDVTAASGQTCQFFRPRTEAGFSAAPAPSD
jgi:hypothetical protein